MHVGRVYWLERLILPVRSTFRYIPCVDPRHMRFDIMESTIASEETHAFMEGKHRQRRPTGRWAEHPKVDPGLARYAVLSYSKALLPLPRTTVGRHSCVTIGGRAPRG